MEGVIKKQYEKFKNSHSHNIIYRSSVRPDKLSCDCVDDTTNEGDPECPQCFGTGLVYKTQRHKVRRSRQGTGSGNSLTADALNLEDEPKSYGLTYLFFFDVDAQVYVKDLIIDRDKARREFSLYIVRNWSQSNGEGGIPALKVAVGTILHKPQALLKESLSNIKKEMDFNKRINKYLNEDALNIIKNYPDKAKESKYIERIVYDILRHEGYHEINRDFINKIQVKYEFDNIEDVIEIIKGASNEYSNFLD